MYSYAAVLNGQVPAATFKNKYVLVGSWGSGLGDAFPTPVSRQGEAMSGVEILANGLLGALHDSWVQTPQHWQTALLSCLPVLLICLALRRLSPRKSFLATDRKSVVSGKSVSVRVDLGGRRIFKKKKNTT